MHVTNNFAYNLLFSYETTKDRCGHGLSGEMKTLGTKGSGLRIWEGAFALVMEEATSDSPMPFGQEMLRCGSRLIKFLFLTRTHRHTGILKNCQA